MALYELHESDAKAMSRNCWRSKHIGQQECAWVSLFLVHWDDLPCDHQDYALEPQVCTTVFRAKLTVILPVSSLFDETTSTVSRRNKPVRSAQTAKFLFAGSTSTEVTSVTRATANMSARAHSCLTPDEIPDFLAAARDPGGDEHRWTCRQPLVESSRSLEAIMRKQQDRGSVPGSMHTTDSVMETCPSCPVRPDVQLSRSTSTNLMRRKPWRA